MLNPRIHIVLNVTHRRREDHSVGAAERSSLSPEDEWPPARTGGELGRGSAAGWTSALELAHQGLGVDQAPALADEAAGDAPEHHAGEFDLAADRGHAAELALMRAAPGGAHRDKVVLGDDVVDGD